MRAEIASMLHTHTCNVCRIWTSKLDYVRRSRKSKVCSLDKMNVIMSNFHWNSSCNSSQRIVSMARCRDERTDRNVSCCHPNRTISPSADVFRIQNEHFVWFHCFGHWKKLIRSIFMLAIVTQESNYIFRVFGSSVSELFPIHRARPNEFIGGFSVYLRTNSEQQWAQQ